MPTKTVFMNCELEQAFSTSEEHLRAFSQITAVHGYDNFKKLSHHMIIFDMYLKEHSVNHLIKVFNRCGCSLCHHWIQTTKSELPSGTCKLMFPPESKGVFNRIKTKSCYCFKDRKKLNKINE
jgi:hypothetical protein